MRLQREADRLRWIWKTLCSSGKFLTMPLLLFALADVIHACLRMALICLIHHGRILDLIDNLSPLFIPVPGNIVLMHQSIPPAPSAPPPLPTPLGNCRAFACLVSPGGGAFTNVALHGGRAFAKPRANPELLTRTRFPIRI